ncbi:FadR/GntR family transcriptional regulator [Paenibacillus sacheonensis]|uniref:FCD domain-containing protein n=1 Tax=Paenibacillus sacheonensis TaxID=742054 RepID=A0A7X4YTD4_9BACL|nr:FadR/GntR family transcriptional regulator [Paenibacillus sacheonensis]MBM7568447.1 GntR family transcriptional repressor for pyruvate dehydrogenase complex [Paenibacillus sacheonensis]NBC72145.1 FCD domain-containing protein [Paenibacillus sacheonensis]
MGKIQKILVHEQVSQEIQNYIQEKELSEGDKLPSVEEMTQMFGVGRSSLREALRYLEAMDIIQVENGKGIFVRDVNTYRFMGKVKIEQERNFLLHTLEVRRALEGQIIRLASKRITDKQIAELEVCLEEYRKLKEAGKDTSKTDLAFHQSIIKAAGNPVLETVMDSFAGLYEKFFNDPLGNKQLFDETYPFHITMFDAIKAHDTENAMEEFYKMMDCIEAKIKSV